MSESKNRVWLWILVVAAIAAGGYYWMNSQGSGGKGAVRIAVVSKGLGPDSDSGILRGARLFAERINSEGGINGQRIELDIYDDQGKKDIGKQKAADIVASDALAAIGHRFSSVSGAAGPIYAEGGMPIVSAASTSPNVTAGNDWYFRTVFNNDEQGRFLAGYIRKALDQRKVQVVHSSTGYGKTLAKVFQSAANELGLEVDHVWAVAKRDEASGKVTAEEVVKALKDDKKPGLLFLIAYPEEAVPVIQAVKDAGIPVQIMGVNALARRDLPGRFSELARERNQPGFYTDGLLVATPMIYDTANEFTGQFRRSYRERFVDLPDWRAAFAYDAMKVITEAMAATEQEPPLGKAERRKAIRDWIAALDGPDRVVPGVTGDNWFDKNGDPRKPVSVAVFQQGVMVSAPFQLTDVRPGEKAGELVQLGKRKMRRTDIVYTGLDISSIDEVDMGELTARIRGELWFRHKGNADPSTITFMNAVEPVELGEPSIEVKGDDGEYYSRYRFDGVFRIDQVPGKEVFGQHLVGIAFRHNLLDRNGIVFVNDLIGMGMTSGSQLEKRLEKSRALSPSTGWRILSAQISSEVVGVSAQGHPDYTNTPEGELEFSTFNYVLRVTDADLSLRRGLSLHWGMGIFAISLLALLVLPFWKGGENQTRLLQRKWWLDVVFALGILVGAESLFTMWLTGQVDVRWIDMVVKGFDVLWWLIPAFLLTLAMERFVWRPVEERSERPVPALLRGFVSILIYLFALFGIVAFVFDEKVTSLLASSGVIAMIIGLAIQMNISHLFSGIALNLERPFRVGDWVKIGSHEDGKVVSMNWRATRLVTRNMEVINLPNTKAAESTIKNYAMPTEVTRLMHKVRVHPSHDTRSVAAVLSKACLAVEGVREDPAPIIFYKGVTEWASEFDVAFFISDYQFQPKLHTDVWHSIWKHLKDAGFEPEIQRQNIRLLQDGSPADG